MRTRCWNRGFETPYVPRCPTAVKPLFLELRLDRGPQPRCDRGFSKLCGTAVALPRWLQPRLNCGSLPIFLPRFNRGFGALFYRVKPGFLLCCVAEVGWRRTDELGKLGVVPGKTPAARLASFEEVAATAFGVGRPRLVLRGVELGKERGALGAVRRAGAGGCPIALTAATALAFISASTSAVV